MSVCVRQPIGLNELRAILGIFKIQVDISITDPLNPFVVLDLPTEECVKQIVSRSMLVRSVYHLWAQGKTFKELNSNLKSLPKDFLRSHQQSEKSYRYTITSFNKHLKPKEKLQKIEELPEEIFTFQGKIQLENADRDYHLLEYYNFEPIEPAVKPAMVYFGQWLMDGERYRIKEYHLKNRHFIANTSMDACLSMIMANMGKVQKNMLVFDPFVGSGSLLVSAAHFGGYVMGTDIDYLLLHAKAKPSRAMQKKRAANESIYSNLKQYDLDHLYVDAFVADSSMEGMWRETTLFDAIITDRVGASSTSVGPSPDNWLAAHRADLTLAPYGIREGAKKVGSENDTSPIREENRGHHVPEKKDYHLTDIFKDLLNFAAKYLRRHGRLVYWFPVSREEYTEDNVPTHPCLQLISNCEQELNRRVSRRLITMEKIIDLQDGFEQAAVKVDHFEDSSFREKYFRPDGGDMSPRKQSCDTHSTNDIASMVPSNQSCDTVLTNDSEGVEQNIKSCDPALTNNNESIDANTKSCDSVLTNDSRGKSTVHDKSPSNDNVQIDLKKIEILNVNDT